MTSPLTSQDLITDLQSAVTVQDYTGTTMIAGVKIVELKTLIDDGGYFLELQRWTKQAMTDFPEFSLQQMNYSEMDPGVIKAWHLHYQQEDIWFVPPSDKLLVCLRDCRTQSPTAGQLLRLVAGAGKAKLIYIPRGVAHGAANLWKQPAAIIYFVNNQFTPQPDVTDEHRLPWDQFGTSVWELTRG
ncbi:MAG: dTDP-4-dehydrorhamnose 3,5-epimerase family protein [Candidatus Kerfeldbacteria bacterium]|nr:dTDP-4-dehydrorhamnose 3,5-epimerase family protein [Candidatus Kerfeldbacteria bacterium]